MTKMIVKESLDVLKEKTTQLKKLFSEVASGIMNEDAVEAFSKFEEE